MMSYASYWTVMWEVEVTDEFLAWWRELNQDQQESLTDRIDLLSERGPALGRPVVDRIHSSRHQNMKELRGSKDGVLPVLFAFDPRRTAILLLGGDKTGQWNSWYRQAVPLADDLYDQHLADLSEEGLI
jgi:hypothetical protein